MARHAPRRRCDMEVPSESSSEEITRLRTCLNDLVSVMALSALWRGDEQAQIVNTLLDTLLGTLRLDFVSVRLNDPEGGPSVDEARNSESLQGTLDAREISQTIVSSLGDAPLRWPPRAQVLVQEVELSVACAPIGLRGEIGMIVGGSLRPDFPMQTEKLVLDVAANQAAIGLQEARLLRQGERNSRLLMDSIPGLVALLTTGGEVEFVNRQILDYTGGSLEEMKQWGTNGIVHPEDLPQVIETFTQSIVSGSPYEIVQRLRRSDGDYLWFQNNGFPLRDAREQIVYWCVLLTDIDERKRAEDALRESERESRLIVDSIPGLIVVFTPDGEVEFVNRQTHEFFDIPLEQHKHWQAGATTHPDDLPRAVEIFSRAISSGEPFEMEVRARRLDGVYR
jgi:PAS domain S-box-containing protein